MKNVLALRGGIGIIENLAFYAQVPFVLNRTVGASFDEVSSNGVGDIDLRLRYALLNRHVAPVGFAVEGLLGVPSGTPSSLTGTGGFSGVPTYTLWNSDFEYPETFKANVGFETRLVVQIRKHPIDAQHICRGRRIHDLRAREQQFGRLLLAPCERERHRLHDLALTAQQ